MEIKEKLLIDELMEELNTGELGEYFCDYKEGYICDIISEIADNKVGIYWDDIFEWAKGNVSYIEEALEEFGTPTDNKGNADFIRIIQQGWYYANEQNLYENLEESLKNWAYNYIKYDLKIEEITEEENSKLLEWNFIDNNEELQNLSDFIEQIFKKDE